MPCFSSPGSLKTHTLHCSDTVPARVWNLSERHHLHGGHQEWFRQFHSGERTQTLRWDWWGWHGSCRCLDVKAFLISIFCFRGMKMTRLDFFLLSTNNTWLFLIVMFEYYYTKRVASFVHATRHSNLGVSKKKNIWSHDQPWPCNFKWP